MTDANTAQTEREHTPGPWEWEYSSRGNGRLIALTAQQGKVSVDVLLATGDGERAWAEASEADARLIAAAPDLLEACKRAERFIRNGIALGYITMPDKDTPDPAHETPDILRTAINKAEKE